MAGLLTNDRNEMASIHGDEYYTQRQTVEQILDNLIDVKKVWCPFDTDESYFPIVFRERGIDVVNTHITGGYDFFQICPPEGCDSVVSNPPFSKKKQVLQRLDDIGIKFAVIIPCLWMNDAIPFEYAHQLMLFRHRIKFAFKGTIVNKTPISNCCVVSNGLLKKDFTIIK